MKYEHGKNPNSRNGFKKGVKRSKNHQINLTKALRGRKFSIQARKKMSKLARQRVMEGKHNNYKGGVTPLGHLIRESCKYKLWRESIFKRDNYTCLLCGTKGCTLNADHITPFSMILSMFRIANTLNGKILDYNKLYIKALRFKPFWDINNGRTLCLECHKKTDNYLKNTKKGMV